MTGLMPLTLGLLSNGGHSSVMDDAISMASIFKLNGYKTYTFGKRHLRDSIDEGWDVKKDHAFKPDDDRQSDKLSRLCRGKRKIIGIL
jgi:arylsulfatase A-like enzyme